MTMGADREFLGNGFAFPLQVTERGGFAWARGEANVQRAIWLILSTSRGEAQMEPRFGCGIHDLVFRDNTPAVRAQVATLVRGALLEWEKRIDIVDVRVREGETPAVMVIEIDYRLRATHALGNLVYPFYIQDAG